jgi:hypothetical protein
VNPEYFIWSPNGLWLICTNDSGRQVSSFCGRPTLEKSRQVAGELLMVVHVLRGDGHEVTAQPGRVKSGPPGLRATGN